MPTIFDQIISANASPLLTTPAPAPVRTTRLPSVEGLMGTLGGGGALVSSPASRVAPSLQAQSTAAPVAPVVAAGGYSPDPRLVAAIIKYVPPQFRRAALATTLVEAGGRLNAVGDQGTSYGPYQMHRGGRLTAAGFTPAQAQDPVLSTQAFWRETGRIAAQNPGMDWAELMAASQRPADRAGYVRKLRAVAPAAEQILGSRGGGAASGAPGAPPLLERTLAPGGPGGLSRDAVQTLVRFGVETAQRALGGRAPSFDEAMRTVGPILEAARRSAPSSSAPSLPSDGAAPAASAGPGGLVRPLATRMGGSQFGVQDAEGAPSARGGRYHAAVDWFAPAGAPVRSPVFGRVVEVKASRGSSGQVYGGTVKVQDPTGRVFVFRHVDPRVQTGQTVQAGVPIAAVGQWTGGSPHAHHEIWKTLEGGYRYENMIDPATVYA